MNEKRNTIAKWCALLLAVLLLASGCAKNPVDDTPESDAAFEMHKGEAVMSEQTAAGMAKTGAKIRLPDPVLKKRLQKSLVETKRPELYGTKFSVYQGHVMVTGQVASLEERHLVESVARTSPGVQSVTMKVKLKSGYKPRTFHGDRRGIAQTVADRTLMEMVRTKLARDPMVSAGRINVEVYENVVILSGYVGSEAEMKKARHTALFVDGVRSVVNHLVVEEK